MQEVYAMTLYERFGSNYKTTLWADMLLQTWRLPNRVTYLVLVVAYSRPGFSPELLLSS